jgi:hypothetical protein
MTDEERRNRNPKPETERTTLAEVEANHPQVMSPSELELHQVYVIQSAKYISTWNYVGVRHLMHAVTLDAVVVHCFHAPRVNADACFEAKPDGTYRDAVGTRIVIRKWTGKDA